MLVFESAGQDQVSIATKVTFDIEFGFNEVKYMLWLSVDLSANLVEVSP